MFRHFLSGIRTAVRSHRNPLSMQRLQRLTGEPQWTSYGVRIVEDDVAAWTVHALLRGRAQGWIDW